MSTDGTPPATERAEQVYEGLRAINHDTVNASLPTPVVYDVLGNLKGIGWLLPQALTQLAAGLGRSLNEYDVREDDGGDPVQNIAIATDHLTRAALLAEQLGEELTTAQNILSGQGYRIDTAPVDRHGARRRYQASRMSEAHGNLASMTTLHHTSQPPADLSPGRGHHLSATS